ncbi:MAG TPA: phosphate ABC transporter permease subunit PstC [Acidimicrobiia bacterium]|nr:phosphate ABC transporter permease subunit PstC [Acidimicrobiia bacterium]
MAATSEEAAVTPVSLRASGANRRRLVVQTIFKLLFGGAALSTVGVTILVVLSLLLPSIRFFQEVSVAEFFGSTRWTPLFNPPSFGVWPIVAGTLWIMVISLVVAIPLGLGLAVYLSEYAHRRVRAVLKPFLEILAGIPTVVLGFFGLFLVNPEFVRRFWPIGEVSTFSGLAAGLVVGVMIIPTVASLSEDAMTAVPRGLREGGMALGGTRREVATKVVFPAALSGIVAAVVLAGSRAIGETTIVLLVAGSRPTLTWNPGEQLQSMASFIGFAGIGDQPTGSIGYHTIFAVGLLLFVITLLLNILSIRIVRRFREIYE